eukprot:scaffold994_cov226-Prasinococcus_capsulatus_cf.AAC.1
MIRALTNGAHSHARCAGSAHKAGTDCIIPLGSVAHPRRVGVDDPSDAVGHNYVIYYHGPCSTKARRPPAYDQSNHRHRSPAAPPRRAG